MYEYGVARFGLHEGEMLAEMEKAQGKPSDLVTTRDQVDDRATLSDLGIAQATPATIAPSGHQSDVQRACTWLTCVIS